MWAHPKTRTLIALALTLAFTALLMTEISRDAPVERELPQTASIRQDLQRVQRQLLGLERTIDTLHEVNESEQIALMNGAIGTLRDCLLPQLALEEKVLYPAVDRRMAGGLVPFTQALQSEHQLMRRWIEELHCLANETLPDHNAFARRAERLLGLLEAHFEVEESLLFPILDQPASVARYRTGLIR
ncbi:MAG: hemerythrin domain-containing protein [Planctomycetes bacterium]|nr:hemerythrin domain-containing protein [Planctomycetota bacterium]